MSDNVTGQRLGKLPARQSRNALMFSDFVKYTRVPRQVSYWKRKPPLPARTFGNDQYGNCVLEGTALAASGIAGATRARYVGPVITVTTECGKHLTITPNHPILTPRGFVPAQSLQQGDYLIGASNVEAAAASLMVDLDYVPALAEQVFATLDVGPTRRGFPRPNEFHGDAVFFDGEVDVVWADRSLRDRHYLALSEQVAKSEFMRSTLAPINFAGQCAPHFFPCGAVTSASREISLSNKSLASIDGHTAGAVNGSAAAVATIDADGLETARYSAALGSQLTRNLIERCPGLICLEQVTAVNHHFTVGHVYDLTTLDGWYWANGIVVHNCTRAKQAYAAMRMERLEQRGKTIEIADVEVIRVYVEMSNRLYGGGDNGAYEEDALNEWRRPDTTFRDVEGHPLTIDGYLKINHAKQDELRAAMALAQARGIAICLNLPEAYANVNPPDVWGTPPEGTPFIDDWMPGSWGAHSLWSLGDYDAVGVWLDDTWGFGPRKITWDALAAYCDEAHMVVDSVDAWRKTKASDSPVTLNMKQFVGAVNEVSTTKIRPTAP